ncbi:MAG TPA: hypothetical protein VFE05_04250 [Longimicrobiaceae bacterium]|jgi:hypothetical protein|nr:hypothetical protein [Longimicrobiaceae bacterium]
MPGTAPAFSPPAPPSTPPSVRTLQLAELQRVSAKFGFDPLPNELPYLPDPEPARDALARHLSHLRLGGTVLDPGHQPKPRLSELRALDGVPLLVDVLDRYPCLERCILCGGAKGETYTICAGCYTTQLRYAERALLQLLPDIAEGALTGIKPLTHDQFVRAIRSTPRLQPRLRARPEPAAEAACRRTLDALGAATRATRLEALQAAAAEPALKPTERRRLQRQLSAAEAAEPWSAGAWHREAAELSLDAVWLDLLARGDSDEPDADDDEYPVEHVEADWLTAPDRVASHDELSAPFLPRPNTAAGEPEHAAALERNALLYAWRAARRRMDSDPDAGAYAAWLATRLEGHGGIPALGRSRAPQPLDSDECERWDRWVDAILGGEPAAAPDALDPFDAGWCRLWGEAATTTECGCQEPIELPQLDRGLPSGRLRWPHFIREEIEAELAAWGRWEEIPEDDGRSVRAWVDPDPVPVPIRRPRRRRLLPDAVRMLRQRRLDAWSREGAPPQASPAPATSPLPKPKGSRRAWECEIRRERRRRRFERMARAHALVHPTHAEHARTQTH